MTVWAVGMKETPFWHEAAPPEPPSGTPAPPDTDVAIIGAGYTGLACAMALAAAGRRAVVFEAGAPGAGASSRNGGMIGWGHRAKIETLARTYGRDNAVAMLGEARASLDFTLALIDRLPGETMYRRTGRFLGAASPRHFAALADWARTEAPVLGMEVAVVPRAEQGRHIATDLYHGGLHLPQHGGLHPALFHKALLDAARGAGAAVIDHCPVAQLAGGPGGWTLRHAQGETRAAEVVYAGNGYTGGSAGPFASIAQRLIPIPSTIIATEPLGANRMGHLFPGGNMIVETRATHGYFRPDPWGERILFGGRASLNILPERESARLLRDMMLSVFPDLGDVRLTHSWKGFVAFTFDGVPHAGQLGGVWHACGYNGSGVAMAPYLGWKLAQRMLGLADGATGFDRAAFRAQAFYRGNPWFLSVLELWYKLKDRREGVAAIRRRA
ncbi:MAG: FAD-binding oxidoreductase [Thermohalobaculum sp.]|nr:FAD-binding oxidoreductase [Thermohalobaculum sp.]